MRCKFEAKCLQGVDINRSILKTPKKAHQKRQPIEFFRAYWNQGDQDHKDDDYHVHCCGAFSIKIINEPAHKKCSDNFTEAEGDHSKQRILIFLILLQIHDHVFRIAF